MIELYYHPTPNTWKVAIMLEECGLPYQLKLVNIHDSEQFSPEFLKINPNGRVPAIVDTEASGGPLPIFESGAILIYLAEKSGRFLASSGAERAVALEWLFWQMSALGPIAGQAHYFRRYAPEGNEHARERFTKEATRLYGVLDRRLGDVEWLAGDYSIADMSCWGWVFFHRMHGQSFDDFPHVGRWFKQMSDRPAVVRAKRIGLDNVSSEMLEIYDQPYYSLPDDYGAEGTRVR